MAENDNHRVEGSQNVSGANLSGSELMSAIASGQNIDAVLNQFASKAQASAIANGTSPEIAKSSSAAFKESFLSGMAENLSPLEALEQASSDFESSVQTQATLNNVQSAGGGNDLMAALSTGRNLDATLKQMPSAGGESGGREAQSAFLQDLQSNLSDGKSLNEAVTSAEQAKNEAIANVKITEQVSSSGNDLLNALVTGRNVDSAISTLKAGAVQGGDASSQQSAAQAFVNDLSEAISQGKTVTSAVSSASSAADIMAKTASSFISGPGNSGDALLNALASGKQVGQVVAKFEGGGSAAFQNSLATSLSDGVSINSGLQNASSTFKAVVKSQAAVNTTPVGGSSLLTALATGNNVDSQVEKLTAAATQGLSPEQVADVTQSFQSSLSESFSQGESTEAAVESASVVAKSTVEVATEPAAGGDLLVAMATGEGVSEVVETVGGGEGGEAQEAFLSSLADGESIDGALDEA
ncbi:MAG: hypothetical protein HQL71_15795, partial [Magnetococcales bacterium]|nr:hypothetical protein [Magnetococcales bacterium]